MGLLDSNKVFNTPKEKRGTVNIDLTKKGTQGADVNVEGINKLIVKVTFNSNENSSIYLLGGSGSSDWTPIDIYTVDGVKADSYRILSNGIYIADVSNVRAVIFSNYTEIQSGTATVEYTGKTSWSLIDELKMWENNILPTYNESEDTSKETFDISAKQTLKVKTNTKLRYGALVVNITSVSEGASISVVHNYRNLVFINELGEICNEINKVGIYYIPCSGINSITLYNNVAVTGGNVEMYANFTKRIPAYLETLKPNQIISSFRLDLSSNKAYYPKMFTNNIITNNVLPYFKFIAINVQSYNSSGEAKMQTFNIGLQSIKGKNLSTGDNKTVLEINNTYRGQSEWIENNAVMNMYINIFFENAPSSGDYLNIEVVGIR